MNDRRILRTWLPLAASWALMTLDSPIVYAGIARLPEAEKMLAAAGIAIALEVTIESPVIMLLATSTALARTHAAYRVLRRFTIHLNLGLTLLAGIVAFVPAAFEWIVPGLMGVPPAIAAEVRPALAVMTLWTAAIGWRRFLQGILIRFGESRVIGYGTALRLVLAAGSAIGLTVWEVLPGVLVGAVSWMSGVLVEVVFVHVAARGTIRRHLAEPTPQDVIEPGPSYLEVVRYHAPLAATSVLSLLAMPIIGAALSRMPDPERALAAWPVLFSLLLFFRSPGLALPETVIALLDRDRMRPLRRFCMTVGVASSAALLLCALTPALPFLLSWAQAVEQPLVRVIVPAALIAALVPALQCIQSWLRGVLMTGGSTGHVYLGNCVSLAALVATLALALVLDIEAGVLAAVAAVTLSMAAETVYLARRAKGVEEALPSAAAQSLP